MIKKRYMITLTLAFCLATALFITVVAQPPGAPEPAQPEPTPTPFSAETDVLILRGTKARSGDDTVHHLLIDEDTPYPNQNAPAPCDWNTFKLSKWGDYCARLDVDSIYLKLAGIQKCYDEMFIHERNPPKGYIISGMPTVSLTFNVTSGELQPAYTLVFYANLYKYSVLDPETMWTKIIRFGDYARTIPTSAWHPDPWQLNIWFGESLHEPIYIASHERLALQVMVWGSCVDLEGVNVQLDVLHTMNTDEFLVSIPVQYEGK